MEKIRLIYHVKKFYLIYYIYKNDVIQNLGLSRKQFYRFNLFHIHCLCKNGSVEEVSCRILYFLVDLEATFKQSLIL